MTVNEIAKVMGRQFVAVSHDNGKICYSGNAEMLAHKFDRAWYSHAIVKEIKAPINESSATIIYI